jgi:hypothetical protein
LLAFGEAAALPRSMLTKDVVGGTEDSGKLDSEMNEHVFDLKNEDQSTLDCGSPDAHRLRPDPLRNLSRALTLPSSPMIFLS